MGQRGRPSAAFPAYRLHPTSPSKGGGSLPGPYSPRPEGSNSGGGLEGSGGPGALLRQRSAYREAVESPPEVLLNALNDFERTRDPIQVPRWQCYAPRERQFGGVYLGELAWTGANP